MLLELLTFLAYVNIFAAYLSNMESLAVRAVVLVYPSIAWLIFGLLFTLHSIGRFQEILTVLAIT